MSHHIISLQERIFFWRNNNILNYLFIKLFRYTNFVASIKKKENECLGFINYFFYKKREIVGSVSANGGG